MKVLKPEDQLVVAADFRPDIFRSYGREWAREQVLKLAESLQKTGCIIKINSAARASGHSLIDRIHQIGVRVFDDLKLFDIPETLVTDGVFLREAQPEFLTVVCSTGFSALRALKAELPNTEVLGITVLSSFTDDDSKTLFACSTKEAVLRFARLAEKVGLDGLVSAPHEVRMLKSSLKTRMSLNTPGIRPAWSIVPGDDQNPDRVMTPAKAIEAGADRVIVGRPIVWAKSQYDAAMRTLDEIVKARK